MEQCHEFLVSEIECKKRLLENLKVTINELTKRLDD